MDKQITFKIDGKELKALPGQTILAVAEANGIAIPSLCFSQKISRTTSCFVCVIKDVKSGRFLPSCSACPMEGGEYDSSSAEVADMRKTALELLLSEHAGDCEAPCTIACPAHASVEEYVRAGRRGDFLESLKIIKKRIPLPMSIGRVCPRFCEKDCRKNVTAKAVSINDFKRLAADMFYSTYREELPDLSGKKVVVVGAGPAGLATAYYLRLGGVAVKILDKQPLAGGMLRYGIPEYRLPKSILDQELKHFSEMGIEIECGKTLGKDFSLAELSKNYDAVVVAIGCWKPSSMHCEGEEFAEQGIKWLEQVALSGNRLKNPGRTIVVGGGNTAMDCLRTAVRLGSPEVTCCYRRTEKEMPAEAIEIHEAREEGVKFSFLTAPLSIRKEGDHLVMTCQKMELGEPDASGRRKPVPVAGSEYEVEADTIIAAIGQATAGTDEMKVTKRGDVLVDNESYLMIGNIFGAGDCVTGAATVVEGVAGGRKAALGVLRMLGLTDEKPEKSINVSRGQWQSLTKTDLVFLRSDVSDAPRVEQQLIPVEERKTTFKEVAQTLPKELMIKEGERCIECSCTAKSDCKLKKHSETYGAQPDAIRGTKVKSGYDTRHPAIIHDRMKCIKCGICVKVCKEVVNQNLLSAKKRGFNTVVGTAFGKVLPTKCTECGECVRECPVGALDWKIKQF